jgi:predicted Zn-dependent protease
MRSIIVLFVLMLALISSAVAETVEVAPGVRVTKKTYAVPANEQPFFGFVTKNPAQVAADEKFIADVVQLSGSRQRALGETLKRGWAALFSGDAVVASRRFNQAYLLAPEQSGIYHAFAALVQTRFNDTEYADELFRIALKQPDPSKNLRADYGRLLLIARRPADARPILEQAVVDAPTFGNAWSNLAFARLQTGDRSGACAAAAEAEKLANKGNVNSDIVLLKREAKC